MNNTEIAEYIRGHYSREEYLLLTLTSCSLLMTSITERYKELPPEIEIIEDTLTGLREDLNEQELLTVSVMLAEIDRLRGDDNGKD
jgi:hypothetical protein